MDCIVLAGEPSGDALGAPLISQLLQQNPSLKIGAVAGPLMRKEKIELLFPMEELQVMGFVDVLASFPKLFSLFFKLRNQILSANPKIVVCIDYPDFHLRLADSLRNKGFQGKIVHYACPSIWAWRKKRARSMEKNLDLLLTLFPFEEALFAQSPLKVRYVGHPLVKKTPPRLTKPAPILALFPGSRHKEIEKNLPIQIEVAKKIHEKWPHIEIHVSVASPLLLPSIEQKMKGSGFLLTPPEKKEWLLQHASWAIATSGTVTLELALAQIPTVVTYAISPLDTFLAYHLLRIRLPFYCIVNILLGKECFPELYGPRLSVQSLDEKISHLIETPSSPMPPPLFDALRTLLGTHDPSHEGARAISALFL